MTATTTTTVSRSALPQAWSRAQRIVALVFVIALFAVAAFAAGRASSNSHSPAAGIPASIVPAAVVTPAPAPVDVRCHLAGHPC